MVSNVAPAKTVLAWVILSVSPSLAIAQTQASWTWNRDFSISGYPGNQSFAMTVYDPGTGPQLFVGGDLWGSPGYADWVIRWSPTTGWIGMGPYYLDDYVIELASYDDGSGSQLYASGYFTSISSYGGAEKVARWNATLGWRPLPHGGFSVGGPGRFKVFDDGTGPGLYMAGNLSGAGGVFSRGVIRYDATGYHSLAGGVDSGDVTALCVFDEGAGPRLFVGGSFTSIGGAPFNHMARWDGTAWSPVGGGADWGPNAMATFDDGTGPALYAGTRILSIGATYFAKWDGVSWTTPMPQPSGPITNMVAFDDGRGPALFCAVVASSPSRRIARFDGHSWKGLGEGLPNSVHDLGIYDAGRGPELHLCGDFGMAGGNVASPGIASWRNANGPIDLFCPGDGSYSHCPCTTFGLPLHGCPNSVDPSGGLLTTSGATADDSLAFHASSLPPNTMGLLFQGDDVTLNWIFAPTGNPLFGDGLRCVGGNILRLYTKAAVNGNITAPEVGDLSIRARVQVQGGVLNPGAVRFYQLWYRDPAPTFCISAATWNMTNGVRVVW